MLLGEYRCSADKRGRVTLPSDLREELLDGCTITRGIERCILIYPVAEWEKLAEKMRRHLPMTSEDARAFRRLIFSAALACAPDQGGQISLSSRLREYAGIGDEAVIVGLSSHLEIWDTERWQKMQATLDEGGVDLAKRLKEFGV